LLAELPLDMMEVGDSCSFLLPRLTPVRKTLTLALFLGLALFSGRTSAQVPEERRFDCGTIGPSPSGNSMVYRDLGRGFRFEFPQGWIGRQVVLRNPDGASDIIVNPLLAPSDPKFYLSEGAKITGSKVIHGLKWKSLTWPDGRRGYYAYGGGLAIEFVAMGYGKTRAPSAETLAALTCILSTFSLEDDPARVDRQLAALKPRQKMGALRIGRIVPGTGGFDGTMGRIEFAGQLTLTGIVHLEGTMRSSSGYYMSVENAEAALIPRLKCPLDGGEGSRPAIIKFVNQDFAEQQFGKQPRYYYQASATLVVDHLSATFYSAGLGASISARLVKVINKRLMP
jgi:hypothetical protein